MTKKNRYEYLEITKIYIFSLLLLTLNVPLGVHVSQIQNPWSNAISCQVLAKN